MKVYFTFTIRSSSILDEFRAFFAEEGQAGANAVEMVEGVL
jgi:hypothetical protein